MTRASARELRIAAVCLINRVRAGWGLPPVAQRLQLDLAAQGHSVEMVLNDNFSHNGPGRTGPGARVDRAGFRWSELGEAISTGLPTPAKLVAGWLSDTYHCQILLSPTYRLVGIGVSRGEVRGYANQPGTWTADMALGAGSRPPSGNWGPADGCPH